MNSITDRITAHWHMNQAGIAASHNMRESMLQTEYYAPLHTVQEQAAWEINLTLNSFPRIDDVIHLLDKSYCSSLVPPLEAIAYLEQQIQDFIQNQCQGSHALFAAIWNSCIGNEKFETAFFRMFCSIYKPIVSSSTIENNHSTSAFLARHGKSAYDSKQMKVGRRTPNRNTTEGASTAKQIAADFADQLRQYLEAANIDSRMTIHTSSSPNTALELGPIFAKALDEVQIQHSDPSVHMVNESQDFGMWTGISKEDEKKIVEAHGISKDIVKHPLFMYPGGDIFAIFLAKYIAQFKELMGVNGNNYVLCTHSSSLQALVMGYNTRMQSLVKDVTDLRSHKENQECVIGIHADTTGIVSPYAAFIGKTSQIPVLATPPKPTHTIAVEILQAGVLRTIQSSVPAHSVGHFISTLEKSGCRVLNVKLVS